MSDSTKPKLSIEYCTSWGYDKRAAGLAAEIKREVPGVGEIELIPSGGGVFEVRRGGDLIFSKRGHGRFPDEGEVIKLLKSA